MSRISHTKRILLMALVLFGLGSYSVVPIAEAASKTRVMKNVSYPKLSACVTASPTAVTQTQSHVATLAEAGDQTLITVQSGCYTYQFVGAAGSTFSYSQGSAAILTPDSKGTGSTATAISLNTVYNNALEVGFTPAQATQMVNQASAVSASVSAKIKPKAIGPAPKKGSIIGSACAAANGNGGQATGRTCDVQVLLQANSLGDWYIGDELTTSGRNGTWWNNLENLTGNNNYSRGNQVVEWNPSGYHSTGSCSQISESVGFGGTGVGSTQTVCPNGIGPEWSNPTTGFGVTWTGCSGNTQGDPGVDVIHSPPNVSDSMVVRISLAWGYCL